jgi:CheY-like chemotaxis protein
MQQEKTILIIDDNEDIRDLLGTVLRLKGFTVNTASDIEIATIKEKPDIILMDVMLSGKSGLSVCASLKNDPFTKSIPVIMFSGLTDGRQQCMDAGADGFISKPFKIPALFNLIETLLHRSLLSGSIKTSPI